MNIVGPSDARLNPRQARFVDQYLIDGCGSGAYQRAGYRARGNAATAAASRMLTVGKVKDAITAGHREICQQARLDAAWVELRLMQTATVCMEAEPFDAMGACKALELLGKRLQLFSGSSAPVEAAAPLSIASRDARRRLLVLAERIRAQEEDVLPVEEEPQEPPLPDESAAEDPAAVEVPSPQEVEWARLRRHFPHLA